MPQSPDLKKPVFNAPGFLNFVQKRIKMDTASWKSRMSTIAYADVTECPDAIKCDDIILDGMTDESSKCSTTSTTVIQHSTDRNICKLSDICVTPDGTVMVVDHGNSKLLRLESSSESTLTLRDYYVLTCKPWSVCCTNSREVVVSLPDRKLIQWFYLQDKLTLVKSLKFYHSLHVLAHHEGKLYVSGAGPMVYVYTTSGIAAGQLSLSPNPDTDRQFSNYHMVVSSIGDVLFAACGNEGLLAVDIKSGKLVWRNKEECLKDVRCACADGLGNIYVCGRDASFMVKLAENGEKSDIINGVGRSSTSICFDVKHSRLILVAEEMSCIRTLKTQ